MNRDIPSIHRRKWPQCIGQLRKAIIGEKLFLVEGPCCVGRVASFPDHVRVQHGRAVEQCFYCAAAGTSHLSGMHSVLYSFSRMDMRGSWRLNCKGTKETCSTGCVASPLPRSEAQGCVIGLGPGFPRMDILWCWNLPDVGAAEMWISWFPPGLGDSSVWHNFPLEKWFPLFPKSSIIGHLNSLPLVPLSKVSCSDVF